MKLMATLGYAMYAQVDMKNATIKLTGGGSNPVVVTIKVGDGNLTYSEKRNIEYTLDRGRLDEVREGDEVPMDAKFDCVWDYIMTNATLGSSSANPKTALDMIKNPPVSTDADACRPKAIDIVIELDPACSGAASKITLPDFRWESLDYDLKAGTIACSGKCNAKEAVIENLV